MVGLPGVGSRSLGGNSAGLRVGGGVGEGRGRVGGVLGGNVGLIQLVSVH